MVSNGLSKDSANPKGGKPGTRAYPAPPGVAPNPIHHHSVERVTRSPAGTLLGVVDFYALSMISRILKNPDGFQGFQRFRGFSKDRHGFPRYSPWIVQGFRKPERRKAWDPSVFCPPGVAPNPIKWNGQPRSPHTPHTHTHTRTCRSFFHRWCLF